MYTACTLAQLAPNDGYRVVQPSSSPRHWPLPYGSYTVSIPQSLSFCLVTVARSIPYLIPPSPSPPCYSSSHLLPLPFSSSSSPLLNTHSIPHPSFLLLLFLLLLLPTHSSDMTIGILHAVTLLHGSFFTQNIASG